ncbi:hypothetical protein DFAR_1450032 [Desulfarculales bacterium]
MTSRSVRNHNPGTLIYSDFSKAQRAIGHEDRT